jgi:hypothetical protein
MGPKNMRTYVLFRNSFSNFCLIRICVRGGPNQPLHRDPQWSIVLLLEFINYKSKQ